MKEATIVCAQICLAVFWTYRPELDLQIHLVVPFVSESFACILSVISEWKSAQSVLKSL